MTSFTVLTVLTVLAAALGLLVALLHRQHTQVDRNLVLHPREHQDDADRRRLHQESATVLSDPLPRLAHALAAAGSAMPGHSAPASLAADPDEAGTRGRIHSPGAYESLDRPA